MLRVRLTATLALMILPATWAAGCADESEPSQTTNPVTTDAGGLTGGTIYPPIPMSDAGSAGGSLSGTAGGSLSGTAGGSLSGTAGGSLSGTAGGSLSGTAGGTTAGGSVAGGSLAGGFTAGGFTAGGFTAGGFIAGGFPSGGGTLAGGAAGGTTAGGTTGGMLPPTSGGTMPTIPQVNGTCPEFKNGTIMVAGHGGVLMQVSGTPNKNGALLFYWHGTGSSASEVNGGFIGGVPASVRNEILSSGGIIASFDGSKSSKAEGDCSGTGAHNISDFKAADQIAACAVKNFGIDPRRIYTTGCSAGGLQSGCMAMLRSSYIAATAPNSGGITFAQKWQDAGKPAVFTMHGGSSDMVIVQFSQTSATFDMAAKQHGSFVVNCNHGGGHCAAPDALKVASWLFMKDHPYGADSPWKGGIPSSVPTYCKIY